jgi:hypothetical protein
MLIGQQNKGHNRFCGVCGEYNSVKVDRNVFNFERYKWGGVRHLDPAYALFDLEQFIKLPEVLPNNEDYQILKSIINSVQELEDNANVRILEKSINKIIKSNKAEREIIIQLLCYCNVLENPEYPGFLSEYINYIDRPDPAEHKNDWNYPSFLWRAKHQINNKSIKYLFPNYL